MNTLTTSSQTEANYTQAVTDILDLMDKYGFATDIPFGEDDFRSMLTKCIRDNIQGKAYNVTQIG